MNKITIETPFIRLDSALKLSGLAQTGGHAKILIQDGLVQVNGECCRMRGKKLVPGDRFELEHQQFEVVSK